MGKVYRSYDSPIIDWFGPLPMYYVKEPEEAFVMLTNPKLLQKSMFYKAMQWAFGNSIFSTLDGMSNIKNLKPILHVYKL